MTKSNMEKEIKSVLDSMYEGIKNENKLKHRDEVSKYVEEYGDDLLDPSLFKSFFTMKHEGLSNAMASTVVNTIQHKEGLTFDREQKSALESLFLDYSFHEAQVRRLIEKYEGHACCADKSRFLLKSYVSYIKSGELPDFGDRSNYRIPNFASPEAWMNVLERCNHLKYGQVEHFMEARDILVNELEENAEKKMKDIDKVCVNHPFYVGKEVEESKDGETICYSFLHEDELGNHEVEIVAGKYDGWGYRISRVTNGEKERVGYEDERPKWFEDLSKMIP